MGVLDPLFDDKFGKVLEGSVVGLFGILREETSRQLPFGKMIGDAVAADAFAAAGFIGAVARCQVLFFFAVHGFVFVKEPGGSATPGFICTNSL
jgi:hypothetical protein